MFIKKSFSIFLHVAFLGTFVSANDCPKWLPMPAMDGLVAVIPIYDESITGPDLDCDEILDAVDTDIDGDGLSNTSESANGTNPRNADTDGDGVSDNNDAFPTNSAETTDSDGDGVGDNADKPRIAQLTPSDGANNVSATANLSVKYERFDTALTTKVAGKTFKIFTADGTEHTNFNVNVSQVSLTGTDTVTINPNLHLVYGKGHYVHIDAGAFKDSTGEENPGISTNSKWNFSVPSNSGPCGCDDFDNSDLPVNLQ